MLTAAALPSVPATWNRPDSAPLVREVSRRLVALRVLLGGREDVDVVWMVTREPGLLAADFDQLTSRLLDMRLAAASAGLDVAKVRDREAGSSSVCECGCEEVIGQQCGVGRDDGCCMHGWECCARWHLPVGMRGHACVRVRACIHALLCMHETTCVGSLVSSPPAGCRLGRNNNKNRTYMQVVEAQPALLLADDWRLVEEGGNSLGGQAASSSSSSDSSSSSSTAGDGNVQVRGLCRCLPACLLPCEMLPTLDTPPALSPPTAPYGQSSPQNI